MSPPRFCAIGIDVGGTKVAAGCVLFPEAETRFIRVIPTHPERGGAAVLDDTVRLAEDLMAEARAAGLSVGALGLGLCELVGTDGRVLSANSVQWMGLPVQDRLSALAPFTLEADVRAAALAEARFGAGRGMRLFLYLTVGTGISSCLVVDGKPFVGTRGACGTMASAPLSLPCEHCGEVNQKNLEQIAAGPALVARLNQRRPVAVQSGQEVLAAAALGDADALLVVRTGAAALGAAVGLLVNVLDPEAIVVGGGLGLSQGLYWDSLCAATRDHIWSGVHRDLPILRAATAEQVGVVGAAAAAWQSATRLENKTSAAKAHHPHA